MKSNGSAILPVSPVRTMNSSSRYRLDSVVLTLTILTLIVFVMSTRPLAAWGQTELTVGYEENPPIAFSTTTGKPAGISVDLLVHVARQQGWSLQWDPCKWDRCLEDLASGKIDLLVGMGQTQSVKHSTASALSR